MKKNNLDKYVQECIRRGLTYAQAQILETCEMIRAKDAKEKSLAEQKKNNHSKKAR